MANKVYNDVNGKPYCEDKEAFVETLIIRVNDIDGEPNNLNAIHQTVVLDPTTSDGRCGTFSESLVVFGDNFFDDGVLASCIEPICSGWDHCDLSAILCDLVVKAVSYGEEVDADTESDIIDSIEVAYTYDGKSGKPRKATLLYSDVRHLLSGPTARRCA